MTKITTEKVWFQEENHKSGIFLKFLPCVWIVVNLPADVGNHMILAIPTTVA
jgi:hypothetical protein